MRVELLTVFSTPRRAYQPGEDIDLPDRDARRLISRKLARPARRRQPELGVQNKGEHAVQRGGTETSNSRP
jgi:hypothetical protein